ncbi:hypothetical protein GIB67_005908 [Kingdonia uniflora]|uniref:Uncharacterized protein n=1 Tax=Kingdonia uniflora TaxID=39325 RepID=A0A7J7MBU0_9MAGN|nr:hypothetical protein GIB67_005908 [Kingdonia uniflora]
MEISGEDGTKISIKTDSKLELGRGSLSTHHDRIVSRLHLSFEPKNHENPNLETRVYFEVMGKNPIWVFDSSSGEIRVFRKSDKGEVRIGDRFCISAKNPNWFCLKRDGVGEEIGGNRDISRNLECLEEEEEMAGNSGRGDDLGFGVLDVSDIDVVKEFGFVVLGHEFDNYPKQKIRDIKNWDWFLEEPKKNNNGDEDEDEDKEVRERKRSRNKKGVSRKKQEDATDDEDWTGESEEDKADVAKVRSKRPRYTTRSKDSKKPVHIKTPRETADEEEDVVDEDVDVDEDEDTLGGFIVTDEEVEDENSDEENEEEDEDFDEDE